MPSSSYNLLEKKLIQNCFPQAYILELKIIKISVKIINIKNNITTRESKKVSIKYSWNNSVFNIEILKINPKMNPKIR